MGGRPGPFGFVVARHVENADRRPTVGMTKKRFARAGESRPRERKKGIVGSLPVRVQKTAAERARPRRGDLMRVENRNAHAARLKSLRYEGAR